MKNQFRRFLTAGLIALMLALNSQVGFGLGLEGRLQYTESHYRIMVGDVLSVNIYNQPDLSHDRILVRSDGNATFQGIGEILVAGKTLGEVRRTVESYMSELVIDPIVTVTVMESQPVSVYLAGAVMRSGMFQMSASNPNDIGMGGGSSGASSGRPTANSKLSHVLANAGGVKMNADLSRVEITRDGVPYRTVNLWNVLRRGDSQEDLVLQAGDSVYIPELHQLALNDEQYTLLLNSAVGPRTFPIRIIGEVEQPGVYELDGRSPLLNSAIAKSGGFKEGANRKVIALRRFSGPDKFSTIYIDPNAHDFTLRPNDVVFISELKVYKAGRFAEAVSNVLSPFTSAATGFMGFSVLRGF